LSVDCSKRLSASVPSGADVEAQSVAWAHGMSVALQ
jgi:hypothetical protein